MGVVEGVDGCILDTADHITTEWTVCLGILIIGACGTQIGSPTRSLLVQEKVCFHFQSL